MSVHPLGVPIRRDRGQVGNGVDHDFERSPAAGFAGILAFRRDQGTVPDSRLSFSWDTDRLSGELGAEVTWDIEDELKPENLIVALEASISTPIVRLAQWQANLSLQLEAERDPFRISYGLNPHRFTGRVLVDLSYLSHQ